MSGVVLTGGLLFLLFALVVAAAEGAPPAPPLRAGRHAGRTTSYLLLTRWRTR